METTHCGLSLISKQSEFIGLLDRLVLEGSSDELNELTLVFWKLYPELSLAFARRVLRTLEKLSVPDRRFEAPLLVILARCYLRCGRLDASCEHIRAAQRIMEDDVPARLLQLTTELEVMIHLACTDLESAQQAFRRLEDSMSLSCGGLNCEQSLLGLRLSFNIGDLDGALQHALRAIERAVTDEQRQRARLHATWIETYRTGDVRRELMQLVPLEHTQNTQRPAPASDLKALLSCRLARCFLSQGKLVQAEVRLSTTDTLRASAVGDPALVGCALQVAHGHLSDARADLDLLQSADLCGQSQIEHLSRRFAVLMLEQMLDGACLGSMQAEEFFGLCEATGHSGLQMRARVLLASAQLASGESELAIRTLKEGGLLLASHKALRLVALALVALCRPDQAALDQLGDLLTDDDVSFVILLVARAHPHFIELLISMGLDEALSAGARRLLDARLVYVRSLLEESKRSLQKTGAAPAFFADPVLDSGHALRIQFFGGLQVRRRGIRIDLERLRRNKVRALLIVLVCARGREVSRAKIMAELWPQQTEERALNNFYVTWNALKASFMADGPKLPRQHCPPERFPFSCNGGRCALLTGYCSSDLGDFDRLVLRIKDAAYRGDDERCFKFADELLTLYQGELLPADRDSEPVAALRLFYRKTFVEIMLLVAHQALASRHSSLALPFIERGLSADPSCEELYRLAMHAYALEGRRDDSLLSYEQCRRTLERELGIEPSQELNDLFSRLAGQSAA